MDGELTSAERVTNAAAATVLKRGSYYDFPAEISAAGIIPGTGTIPDLEFKRGWYLGFQDDKHIFQGKPTEQSYQKSHLKGRTLRRSEHIPDLFFTVLFIGGTKWNLSDKQSA